MATGQENGPDKRGSFWERMAAHYPSPFDSKTLSDTKKVIGIVEERGVEIAGAEILDIACGTGIYALPLAQRAKWVTGLDFSDAMLERFCEVRDRHRLRNVSVLKASWQDIDIEARGLKKKFDIVWTSMTPAIKSSADLARMSDCARHWCVYIGWGRKRHNPLLAEAFTAHGLKFGPPSGAAAIQAILKKQGIAPEMTRVETHWDWQGCEDEAVEYISGFIEARLKAAPDHKIIRDIVAGYSDNGLVRHRTEVEMGVLVWQAD